MLARLGELLDGADPEGAGLIAEFEARIADAVGAPHCVAACNAGVALEITIQALDLSGEVILPAFMSPAAAHALWRQGITPVFCDIDPRTRTLDPRKARALITPRTTGIIAAHLWGEPCDVGALEALARKHGLRLIFDARHAFGVACGGRLLGGHGDAEVFSFDSASVLYAGDGAAITTGDAGLARRLRILQNLGLDEDGAPVCLGLDGRMTAACAAMGLGCFERVHHFIEVGERRVAAYDLLLTDVPGIVVLHDEAREQRTWQHAVIEVDQGAAGLSRDALMAVLRAENVLAGRSYYPGAHRIEPYRRANAEAWLRLQATERLSERVLCLPAGAAAEEADIDSICEIIRLAVRHAGAIMARLSPPARAGLGRRPVRRGPG